MGNVYIMQLAILGVHVNVCDMCIMTFVLQRGGDLPGMGDLRLVERLSMLISGGPKREVCLHKNERHCVYNIHPWEC